jgi:hypothetical protein
LLLLAGCAAPAASSDAVGPVTVADAARQSPTAARDERVELVTATIASASTRPASSVAAVAPASAARAPVATPVVLFTVDREVVDPTGCANLSWSAVGARRLRLLGSEVPATGSQVVCPERETPYYLWYEGADGRPGERILTVRIALPTDVASSDAIASEDDASRPSTTLPPTLEPTPCDTECVVIMPTETPRPPRPTRVPRPSDEPQPTAAPPATDEPPTAQPDPTEAPPATDLPDPTEEPSPLPLP